MRYVYLVKRREDILIPSVKMDDGDIVWVDEEGGTLITPGSDPALFSRLERRFWGGDAPFAYGRRQYTHTWADDVVFLTEWAAVQYTRHMTEKEPTSHWHVVPVPLAEGQDAVTTLHYEDEGDDL